MAGVILFGRDVEGPLEVAELTNRIQRISFERWGRPMIIAIDQEGGRVSRLSDPFTQFPGMEELGSRPDAVQRVREYARTTAIEMSLVGLNMNLAPVLDVRRNRVDEHLRGRTLSDSPLKVGILGVHIIKTLQANGVWTVAKHFPGLGNAQADPHTTEVRINSPIEEMENVDLLPFKMAIQAGVSGIMTSHAVYEAFANVPATFSQEVVGLLRGKLHFDGMIVTDDMLMGAIRDRWETTEAVSMAIKAGHNMAIISKGEKVPKQLLSLLSSEEPSDIGLTEMLEHARKNTEAVLACIGYRFRFADLKQVRDYFHLNYYL